METDQRHLGPDQQQPTREPFYLIASAALCIMAGLDVLLHALYGLEPGWLDYATIGGLVVIAIGGLVLYFRSAAPPQE